MPWRDSIIASAWSMAAVTASSTPAVEGRSPRAAPTFARRSKTTHVMPLIVIAMASHCRAASLSSITTHETSAAVGGASACSSSVSRGPIINRALNAHRSQTKNPISPDKPRISHV